MNIMPRSVPGPDVQNRQAIKLPANNSALCFSPQAVIDGGILDAMDTAGWNPVTVFDAGLVAQLAERHCFPVGLLFISGHLDSLALEQCLLALSSAENTLWLAMLSDSFRMNDETCKLVATCCNDFFTSPYQTRRVIESLGHIAGLARIRRRCLKYRGQPDTFFGMIGKSSPMRQLYRQSRKVAHSDAHVLICGESGSGKELVANAIHRLSARASMPFIEVNSAALPATLIQDELFGHEKGAFTGAIQRRVGRFEAAQEGTLFLDEICDMPLEQQVNLLRVLEGKSIERIGTNDKITLNVRVIAATHADLPTEVKEGRFRADLYYRLNVLNVTIPPLRERGADIDLLANYVLDRYSDECEHHPIKGFDQQSLSLMRTYDWPGNVRELINSVRSAMVMSDSGFIKAHDLGMFKCTETEDVSSLKLNCADSERRCIENALLHSANNMSLAARELGISRTTLYRKLDKLGMEVGGNLATPRSVPH